MKSTFLLLTAFIFLPTPSQAQWWSNPYHASTPAESYLNGAARLWEGRGNYLESRGRYLRDYEAARRDYIDNWAHRIYTRWTIQDAWKERNRMENALDRKERLLDQSERMHALKLREQDLREKGILPPLKSGGFIHNGKQFSSLAEWKESPEYAQRMEEIRMENLRQHMEERAKTQRLQESLDFMCMWRGMSDVMKHRYSLLTPEQKVQYKAEWKDPELKWARAEEERNRRFYETRPDLIFRGKKPNSKLPPVPPGVEEAWRNNLPR